MNNDIIESGEGTGAQITLGLGILSSGLHHVIVMVYDSNGHSASDTVLVTASPSTNGIANSYVIYIIIIIAAVSVGALLLSGARKRGII